MLSKEQMFKDLDKRYKYLYNKYKDTNTDAYDMFEELCCSVYGGDEWLRVYLNKDGYSFTYRGYECELDRCCTGPYETDRYVCFIESRVPQDGPGTPGKMYLVPDAWAWGSQYDCKAGEPVANTIIEALDKFINENYEQLGGTV